MDEKQKKLLAVLCVLVIAMGGTWFFFLRDTTPQRATQNDAPAQKTVLDRGSGDKQEKETVLDRRTRNAPSQQRERTELDRSRDDRSRKRDLDRSRGPKEKKKKIQPMA